LAKFIGADKHLKRLQGMGGAALREGKKLVYVLADMHATEAALSITAGAVSGKGHIASKPGEAPNADTHMLDRSIHVEMTGPLTAQSVADAPYAVALEFDMDRPFMRPAAAKVRKSVDALASAAVDRIVAGSKL